MWRRKATAHGLEHRLVCQTRWQRPSGMDPWGCWWNYIVTVYQWCDCWRREQANWGGVQSAKKDEAPQWGRINQNGGPDLNLNGGFLSDAHASSGCPGVMAVPPFFFFGTAYHIRFILVVLCQIQVNHKRVPTGCGQRQGEGARQMQDKTDK